MQMLIRFEQPTKLSPIFYCPQKLFLTEFRKSNGWTQEQLGDFLGVSNVLISMMETGQKQLSFKTLELIRKKTKNRIEILIV